MLIRNFNLKNQYISYSNLSFDFTKAGLYVLTGKNGVGKSSILEKIVFGEVHPQFDNPEEAVLYEVARYRLFSYAPQTIEESDQTVWDFISKDNPNVDRAEVCALMDTFNMAGISLAERYNRLSGGEKVKLTIISAIVKKTKYIFLDEPSNYLDNHSVSELGNLLLELSKSHVVVIASHDQRIISQGEYLLHIDESGVETIDMRKGSSEHVTEVEKAYQSIKKINYPKIAFLRINKPINFICIALILVFSCYLSLFVQNKYFDNYAIANYPESGVILAYDSDHIYGDFNKTYCRIKGIDVDEQKKYDMIYLDDVVGLAKQKEVKAIYIADEAKYYKYAEFLGKMAGLATDGAVKVEYIAIPEIFQNNETFLSWMSRYEILFLSCGRLPKDGANEVALSKNILKKYFGMDFDDPNEVIGQVIHLDNEMFKIIGITSADHCVVSYHESLKECGVYKYSADSFDEFKSKQEAFYKMYNILYQNVNAIAFVVNPLVESSFLAELIQQYPANNYYSRAWTVSMLEELNGTFSRSVLWIVIPVSLILGIVFLVLQANQISVNIDRLQSYMRYYFTGRIMKAYTIQTMGWFVLSLLLVILFNIIYDSVTGVLPYMWHLVIIDWILMALPSCIYVVFRLQKIRYNERCG